MGAVPPTVIATLNRTTPECIAVTGREVCARLDRKRGSAGEVVKTTKLKSVSVGHLTD